MARAPFQVLIIPYRSTPDGGWEYLLLRRADAGYWQPVAGGGEEGETREQAARREAWEEAGVPPQADFLRLDAAETIRVTEFKDSPIWGDQVYVIPQTCFGAVVPSGWVPRLSHEHSQFGWFSYREAHSLIRFDANRTALWELDRRLRGLGPRGVETLARAGQGLLPAVWQTERLQVQDAGLADVPGLQELFNDCALLAPGDPTFSSAPQADLHSLVHRSLAPASQDHPGAANEFRLQIACFRQEDGGPAGCFHLSHGRPQAEQVWISLFIIHPRFQRQGFGAELLRGLVDQIHALGYATIHLRVFPQNLSSLHFWTQQRFQHIRLVEPTGALILERLLHDDCN